MRFSALELICRKAREARRCLAGKRGAAAHARDALTVIGRIGGVRPNVDVLVEQFARLLNDETDLRQVDLRHRLLGHIDLSR